MSNRQTTPRAIGAITGLILETFRLNGRLLEAGDTLVRDLGLTSARWQVLGAIDAAPTPLPVAHVARNMGLSRQAVQRLANDMERDGLLEFTANPHHERAKLVLMTDKGKAAFAAAMVKQRQWAAKLANGLTVRSIEEAAATLRQLCSKLKTD